MQTICFPSGEICGSDTSTIFAKSSSVICLACAMANVPLAAANATQNTNLAILREIDSRVISAIWESRRPCPDCLGLSIQQRYYHWSAGELSRRQCGWCDHILFLSNQNWGSSVFCGIFPAFLRISPLFRPVFAPLFPLLFPPRIIPHLSSCDRAGFFVKVCQGYFRKNPIPKVV